MLSFNMPENHFFRIDKLFSFFPLDKFSTGTRKETLNLWDGGGLGCA